MQDRIAYQGITFDDVLLEPGYSELLPRDVDVRTQLTAKIRAQHPDPVVADGHGHRERAGHRAGPGGGHRHHPQEPVDRGADPRGGQGQAVARTASSSTRSRCRPTRPSARPARSWSGHNISGVPITVNGMLKGILTRRDLRFLESNDLRIEEVMTKDNLVTAPDDTTLEEAERILTKNKVEKLLLVDDEYRLKGLITIKDIDKLHRYPARLQGRARAAAGRGGGRGPRLRADRVADRGRRRRAGRRLGPRAQPERDRDGAARSSGDYDIDVDRRQRRDRGGDARPDRRRGRRGEGGHRAGLDLHDAGRLGRRRAADHGDLPGGQGGRRAGCRSSPTAASATPATSPRRSPPGPTA